jgi:hypothetical protein
VVVAEQSTAITYPNYKYAFLLRSASGGSVESHYPVLSSRHRFSWTYVLRNVNLSDRRGSDRDFLPPGYGLWVKLIRSLALRAGRRRRMWTRFLIMGKVIIITSRKNR